MAEELRHRCDRRGRIFAMIDDMASLKHAMEQMDAQDPAVAEAGKNRAAQILGDAKLSFTKMAELIEQRRLLLRPRIVASIKRMDQPDMLGEAAFRDAGSALRREGQSFRQVAEAIELNGGPVNGGPAPRYEGPVRTIEPLSPMEMAGEPGVPRWLRALNLFMRVVFFPLRRPIRFFVIALVAFMLFNTLRAFVGGGRLISGYVADISAARQSADAATSWVSSFFEKRNTRPSQQAAAPPTPPAPIPSPSPANSATESAPPAAAAAPSANQWAPPTPSPTASASPPAAAPPPSTPNLDARGPSRSATNDRPRIVRPRAFDDLMQGGFRRNSRVAGPCIGGVGGCYWGGGRY
jgi:hypothetical protein